MRKLIMIFTMIIYIVFVFVACSINKSMNIHEDMSIKNNPPPESKNIGYQQQINNVNRLPSLSPSPSPTSSPKPLVKIALVKNKTIASFSTVLLDTDENRINNIKRAARKVNNYILRPGEVFSFNRIVGKRVQAKGYKDAKIIVDGEREDGIGGGICQLSSTLYNAAKKLELKIIERHSHSGEVHYVPLGQDAAVNYGNQDLKFKNTKKYPVKFKIGINERKLYVFIMKVK